MKIKTGLAVSVFSLSFTFSIILFLKMVFPGLKPGTGSAPIIFLIVQTTLLWGVFGPKSPLFGRVFWRGSKGWPVLALTFDDGPTEPYTSAVVEILKQYDVRATFFLLGRKLELYPEVIKKIAEGGHEIGNHGYSHQVLPLRFPAIIRSEIQRTEELIIALTGRKPDLFRAPHGWKGPFLVRTAKRCGYRVISWTRGVRDTDRPGSHKIIERSLKSMKIGAILLFHDGRGLEIRPDCSQLLKALPVIIDKARRLGFKFMTVSELMAASEVNQ